VRFVRLRDYEDDMKGAGELLCLALAAARQLQIPETVIIGQFLDHEVLSCQ